MPWFSQEASLQNTESSWGWASCSFVLNNINMCAWRHTCKSVSMLLSCNVHKLHSYHDQQFDSTMRGAGEGELASHVFHLNGNKWQRSTATCHFLSLWTNSKRRNELATTYLKWQIWEHHKKQQMVRARKPVQLSVTKGQPTVFSSTWSHGSHSLQYIILHFEWHS